MLYHRQEKHLDLQVLEKFPDHSITFDQAVYEPLVDFLQKTKRTCDKDNKNKLRIPANLEDAIELFHSSPAWNVVHKTFDLDSEEKIAIFFKLSHSF